MVERNNSRLNNLRMLRERLDDSRRSDRDSRAAWRDRQRRRYLERRLQRAHSNT